MGRAVEPGKKSSDIFAGCAPLDWARQVAGDFTKFVWGKVLDIGKAVKAAAGKLIENVGNWLGGFFKGTIQFTENLGRVVASYGLVAIVGRKLAESPCGRAVLAAGGLVAGAVATYSGLKALAASASVMILGAPLLGRIIRGLTRTTQAAYSFNWNISDSEIKNRIKALQVQLAGAFGGALGQAVGNLACGGLAGSTIAYLNPKIAVKMSEVLGEEVLDEVKEAFKSLLHLSGALFRQYAFLSAFKSGRAWLKRVVKYPYVRRILPDKWEKIIESWGAEGSKPWSFALAIEEKIESIQDQRIQNFVEELVEEFMDACADSMIAISYGM